jgi:protein-disulfide isomerase
MNKKIETLLNVTLTVAAVAVAISVVYRTFGPQPSGRRIGDPVRVAGWEDARGLGYESGVSTSGVEVVVLEDPECPVCRSFHQLVRGYAGTPLKVHHVLYPLDYHKQARPASLALECAAQESKFHELLDLLYRKQDSLGAKSWGSFALEAGLLDSTKVAACANGKEETERLLASLAYGKRMGLTGTPTVIIDGWRLPSPPSEKLFGIIVEARARGEEPFGRRAWRAHLTAAGLE